MLKRVSKKKAVQKSTRTFKGLFVVEAEADLILVPTSADLACAVRGDAKNSVFAQCCKRCYESEHVEIFTSCAYIDLPDETAERYLKRYIVPPVTNARIELYDETGRLNTGGYLLKAPAPGQTLDYQAQEKRKAGARTARIIGERGGRAEAKNGAMLRRSTIMPQRNAVRLLHQKERQASGMALGW